MTLLAADPRRLEGGAAGEAALRWGAAGLTVAAACAAAVWLAFAMPAPEGVRGALQDAVMIELEPMTAIEDAPPPAPEETAFEPAPPAAEAAPGGPEIVPEPVVPEPPPEPVAQAPSVEPEPPAPAPNADELVPDLTRTEAAAEAVLNPPLPTMRPPPRPKAEAERRRPRETRRAERATTPADRPRKAERRRENATIRAERPRSAAPRSDRPAASRSAQAPQVSPAAWQRRAVGHFRKFRRRMETRVKGTARVAVTIDRGGRVVSARLASSSGSPLLDGEALALVRRASPIPAPPEGVVGRTVSLTVPVAM